jgi:hypothetical protein
MTAGMVKNYMDIFMAFFHQLEFFSESLFEGWCQHRLVVIVRVIFNKVFPHFIKRIVPLGRNLPPEHGVPFFKAGNSFSVKKLLSGYWVAVCGADWTFTLMVKPVIVSGRLRREGKNYRPRRNFAGNVNGQLVAGGHFYGLRNAHMENIA